MKTSRSLIALTAAALIPLGAAMAGDDAGKAGSFDALDANNDGRISQTEAAVDSKINFPRADANDDGYLDKAEWTASRKGSAVPQTEPVRPADPSMPQPDDETPRH